MAQGGRSTIPCGLGFFHVTCLFNRPRTAQTQGGDPFLAQNQWSAVASIPKLDIPSVDCFAEKGGLCLGIQGYEFKWWTFVFFRGPGP